MTMQTLVARVAVAAAVYSIDRPYDYTVPAALEELAVPGARVLVPFGRGDRLTEGFVLELRQGAEGERLKPVAHIFDDGLALSPRQQALALWMCRRYYCTYFQAAAALLPPGIWSRLPETYLPGPAEVRTDGAPLSPAETGLLQAASQAEKPLTAAELAQRCALPEQRAARLIRGLCSRGLLQRKLQFRPLPGEKRITILRPAAAPEELLRRLGSRLTPQRRAVLDCILQAGALPEKELCYRTGAGASVVKTLVKQGILLAETQPERLLPQTAEPAPPQPFSLNEEQQLACDGLQALLEKQGPEAALLYGVTGSGKTRIYIRLIQRTLELGRSAILLVPEIALTPQVVQQFRQYFGRQVAVLHSGLTNAQRYAEYCRIRQGQARVVIGTRTAVLAPVQSLGCILVDEEQEYSYKSDETDPRYHAREVARYRAAREGCLLVLGSATPSVESYYAAQTGVYHLFTLRRRFQNTPLPETLLADMRGQLKQGDPSRISARLRQELQHNLERGEQSILFLNRRGSARMAACVDCGYIPMCENCSAALTYHGRNDRLMCHHCGASIPMFRRCPMCGGEHIRLIGSGTQSIEDELVQLFPTARVLRMDADTTQGRTTHEALLEQFAQGRADILLGTQMVAKGLDFPRVTLVGVLEADLSLYCGGYRAPERTFSLLAQVVGRAGRRETRGRAVIQTYTPENPVILAAAAQDYDAFYAQEIETRRALKAPPFDDLFVFRFGGREEETVRQNARRFAQLLRQELGPKGAVLGPAPAALAKVNQRYYYTVSFRARADAAARAFASRMLIAAETLHRGALCTVSADVDPMIG